jgi:hypothetical protein
MTAIFTVIKNTGVSTPKIGSKVQGSAFKVVFVLLVHVIFI